MEWLAVLGVAVVVALAVVLARRHAPWRWLVAGAAGWLAAQGLKYVVVLPVLLAGGTPALLRLEGLGWFAVGGALLAGVTEELGKYVPARWLRAATRAEGLALGLGAGALEALVIGIQLVVVAGSPGGGGTLVGALLPVWERAWAVTTHAGLGMIDGLAVVRRQGRWLVWAIGLHTVADLGAGWYQHLAASRAPGVLLVRALYGAEVWSALSALAIWWIALRLWSPPVGRAVAP